MLCKGKLNHNPLQERKQGAHLPSFGHQPVAGYTAKSVTHGQCDDRPMVIPSQPKNVTALWLVPNYTAW